MSSGRDRNFAWYLTLVAVTFASISAIAQINGTRASVTSLGGPNTFFNPPGVRASVTSLGPQGYSPGFHSPRCCFSFNNGHHRPDFGRGFGRGRFPFGVLPIYSMPYYYGYADVLDPVDDTMEQYGAVKVGDAGQSRARDQQYDERLNQLEKQLDDVEAQSRRAADSKLEASAVSSAPLADQPATVLVFRDGHTVEVKNYAIVGDQLYDLSNGSRRKIALADLNVSATEKQNDDRGLDFRLPTRPLGN